jgi:hypothetical protein
VSNLGGLIWLFPLMIGFPAILFVGDRGPFSALYAQRTTVTVGPDGLTWWTAKGGDGRLPWSELGGVSRITGKYSTYEAVFAPSGEEVVGFEGPFKVRGPTQDCQPTFDHPRGAPEGIRPRRPATS